MFYTPAEAFEQAFLRKRPNKTRFDLASLPTIDPYLISIARHTSRFIVEIEEAYTSVIDASSNDGWEVTVTEWFPCARTSPQYFNGERVEIDAAYNIIRGETFDILLDLIRQWHFNRTHVYLSIPDIFDGKFKIDLPIEIQQAVEAFALNDKRREALTDTLVLTMKRRMAAA
jgi:hypothetical protein